MLGSVLFIHFIRAAVFHLASHSPRYQNGHSMPDEQPTKPPSGNPDGQPLTPTPFEAAIEQRIVALEAECRSQQDKEPPSKLLDDVKTGEWWLIGINGLLLIATIIIACIYYHQLKEMQKATKATQQSAYASCLSAELARSTLLEIQSGGADTHKLAIGTLTQAAAATRAEAALMKLKFDDLNPPEPYTVGSKVSIENVGKSAALDVRIEFEVRVLPIATEGKFIYSSPAMNTTQIGFFYPKAPETINVYLRDSDRNPMKVDPHVIGDVNHLRKYVVVYGKVAYRDIFGVSHWIHICNHGKIEDARHGQYAKCAAYNQMDETLVAEARIPPSADAPPEISCKKPEE
jgi:hypothetical protein